MRQLLIQVPEGNGEHVLDMAQSCQGVNLTRLDARTGKQAVDLVIAHIPNRQIEDFVGKLESLPDVHVTLLPMGVMALRPPSNQAAEQVTHVQNRSPIEVFLAGLQSVGSWRGFLGYAAIAGIVVWIGLFTNTSYLLTAAMLIAPFASPAMNLAIGTARGDQALIWRSIRRYFAALGVTIAVAALLSWVLQQNIPTQLMIDRSQVSAVAVLLPLAAGVAGALNLVQSERDSLVSGAATGMLVAASLAPPAGIIGMAGAIGRWDLAIDGVFLLLLQLCGINISATLLFRLYGLSTQGSRYKRGKKRVFPITLLITAIALVGLLAWQFLNPPQLQRSSLAYRANAEVQSVIQQNDSVQLVESSVRFTRPDVSGQNTLLSEVYVQRKSGITTSIEEIRTQLSETIQERLQEQDFNVTPLVTVTVLEPPS